jgi:WD40 repeat protein
LFGKIVTSKTAVSVAFIDSDAVTGLADGYLLLWKARANSKKELGHEGASVTAMCPLSSVSGIASGGKDGSVCIWNSQLVKLHTFSVVDIDPLSSQPQVQALSVREGRIIIGTKGANIYDVGLDLSGDGRIEMVGPLVSGHCDKKGGDELWGIAVHPKKACFATACDDRTVRVWDSREKVMKKSIPVPDRARSVAFSTNGTQLAVGLMTGKLCVFNDSEYNQTVDVQVSKKAILVVRYSPDDSYLAVGTQDSKVYILSTKTFGHSAICSGHHSSVTHLDFSADSRVLQSVSSDYELLFWDVASGKQIKSPSDVRDTKWSTVTSILGWSVQGIWPPEADGTDVNAVSRSPDQSLLVTGDDFGLVKLFRFPCPKEKSSYREYKGHSAHVCNVAFSSDGKFIFSAGGLDKSILQFEVKKSNSPVLK